MNPALMSRRDWLAKTSALVAVAAMGSATIERAVAADELVLNARGGYRFLPGTPFLSLAALAAEGFEIVRTTFRQPRPFPGGLADIEALLKASGRPIHALCGLELRSSRVLPGAEFRAFNQSYTARLEKVGLLVGEQVPVTRTNVALTQTNGEAGAAEVTIHAFSHTMPTARRERAAAPTFVLSGMPEIRNLVRAASGREPVDIVAAPDTTPAGLPTPAALRLKAEFILSAIDETMRTLGVQWTDVTGVQMYTVHDVQPLLPDLILPRLGTAARLGIEWHHVYPPGIQLEIGIRGTRAELVA